MVVTFLFWNVNKRNLGSLTAAIAHEHEIDVLLLAECDSRDRFLEDLNGRLAWKFNPPPLETPGRRIEILSRFPRRCLRLLGDEGGLSFIELSPPVSSSMLVVGAHLPSKMFRSGRDQAFHCVNIARAIAEYEERVGHRRTVLVGDLNMNPFEDGLVAASGLHAAVSRAVAERGARRLEGKDYRFFYNPMWNHFGDRGPSPPGTYYYDRSSETTFFWNMFDQVLVRPDLLAQFDDESVKVLTRAGRLSLLGPNGRPDRRFASDHLPIVFSIRTGSSYGDRD